jgi:hypothetical protein
MKRGRFIDIKMIIRVLMARAALSLVIIVRDFNVQVFNAGGYLARRVRLRSSSHSIGNQVIGVRSGIRTFRPMRYLARYTDISVDIR